MRTLKRFIFVISLICMASLALLLAMDAAAAKKRERQGYVPVQTVPDDLDLLDVGTVKEILKSDLIKLEDDKVYRLDNIRVPVYYNQAALDYLQGSILGKRVGVFANRKKAEGRTDRLGNTIGHVVTEGGVWIQAEMVGKGLAWAYSTETNRDLIKPLYGYEDQARATKAGFWVDPEYAIKDKESIKNYYNTFQIVEDVVYDVGDDKEFYYINFDKDFKSDFTATVDQKVRDMPSNMFNLRRHRIRIRGWIEKQNGPLIEITHPEQFIIVPAVDPAQAQQTVQTPAQ